MPRVGLCLFFVLGQCLVSSAHAQATQVFLVAGTVVNEKGSTVSASVAAVPIKYGGTAASLHWVQADEAGKFELKLATGSYEIRAKDDRTGYADPSFQLSADASAKFPIVKVENSDLQKVHVVLGRQGGILDIAVRDKATASPIVGAKVTIHDAKDQMVFVELSPDNAGSIRFAVPHKALIIIASAPGHSREVFRNGEEIELSNGEERNINFDLVRTGPR